MGNYIAFCRSLKALAPCNTLRLACCRWQQDDPRWALADPICTFVFAILVRDKGFKNSHACMASGGSAQQMLQVAVPTALWPQVLLTTKGIIGVRDSMEPSLRGF